LSARGRGGRTQPLTLPVATLPGRNHGTTARTASLGPSSKGPPSTARSAFHRRVPTHRTLSRPARTWTRHRSSNLAVRVRLPTLFRPSLLGGRARLRRFRELSPAGARRRAPPVDFCNRNDPQARPGDRRNPSGASKRPAFAVRPDVLSKVRGLFSEPRNRVVTGQGPAHGGFRLRARRPSPRLRAPRASPQPDWLEHPLSWSPAFGGPEKSLEHPNPPNESHPAGWESSPGRAFAASRAGPPHARFREEDVRSAAPEVLSVRRTSPDGEDLGSPQAVPSLWSRDLTPFLSSPIPSHGRHGERERRPGHVGWKGREASS
jgi:hypothetical protein